MLAGHQNGWLEGPTGPPHLPHWIWGGERKAILQAEASCLRRKSLAPEVPRAPEEALKEGWCVPEWTPPLS